MIYDNRNLTDGERIRLLASLESDDPFCMPAGELDPEPRRYSPEPALDVPRLSTDLSTDDELSLSEPLNRDFFDNSMRLRVGRYLTAQDSESIRHTHRAQRQARRRALVKRCLWVAGWTVSMLAGVYAAFYVAGWVANLVLEAIS